MPIKKRPYLPFGIRVFPRSLMGTQMNTELEVRIAQRMYAQSRRMGYAVEADPQTIECLKLLPSLLSSLVVNDCLGENTKSLVFEDPIVACLATIADFAHLSEPLFKYIQDSPIACEIMCNFVSRKFEHDAALLDLYASGLSASPERMARLLCSNHSDPVTKIQEMMPHAKDLRYESPSCALFVLIHTKYSNSTEYFKEIEPLIQCIAQDPAVLFEAAQMLKIRKLDPFIINNHLESQTDPRWIYHYLSKSLIPYDSLKSKLEERLMESTAWGVEYLDHQPMEASRLDELFSLCYDFSKGSALREPLTWWYRCHFPEVRRAMRSQSN